MLWKKISQGLKGHRPSFQRWNQALYQFQDHAYQWKWTCSQERPCEGLRLSTSSSRTWKRCRTGQHKLQNDFAHRQMKVHWIKMGVLKVENSLGTNLALGRFGCSSESLSFKQSMTISATPQPLHIEAIGIPSANSLRPPQIFKVLRKHSIREESPRSVKAQCTKLSTWEWHLQCLQMTAFTRTIQRF